jgi:hypothetical protein
MPAFTTQEADAAEAAHTYLTIRTPFEGSASVRLTLGFRHAGTVTIEAPVTGPGTP